MGLLLISLAILLAINILEWWSRRAAETVKEMTTATDKLASGKRSANGVQDPAWVRRLLIAVTVGFVALFVILPAINVFVQAFSAGVEGYREALVCPKPTEPAPTMGGVKMQVRRTPTTPTPSKPAAANLRQEWSAFTHAEQNRPSAITLTLMVVDGDRAAQRGSSDSPPPTCWAHRPLPLPRPGAADHADRPAVFHLARGGGHGLRAALRRTRRALGNRPRRRPRVAGSRQLVHARPAARSTGAASPSTSGPSAHATSGAASSSAPISVFLATAFITFPFVARTLIPDDDGQRQRRRTRRPLVGAPYP